MMLRSLLSLILLFVLGACQVEENISSSKQLSTTNTIPNYVVTLPSNGWKKYNDNIAVALMMPYKMTVSGNPYIDVLIGSSSERLYYQSGSGSNVINFSYTVGSFDIDTDGIQFSNTVSLNGGTLKYEVSGSLMDAPVTFQVPANLIKVDGIIPTVVSLTPPSSGNYTTGNPLNYLLTFSEDVFVTGTPSFNLNMNSGAVPANYRGGSGSETLQFQRLVAVTDSDTTGFTTSTNLTLSSPTITIKDQAGNVFNSTIPATITVTNSAANNIFTGTTVPAVGIGSNGDGYFNSSTGITYLKAAGVWTASTNTLINVTVPSVTSVTAPAGGTYTAGNNLDFTVNWSQAVNVTGSPGILINLTTGSIYANYFSGSGTAVHTYRYTVASGQVDFDGIVLGNLIDLRGGSIKNTLGTQNAALLFTPPATSTILVDAGLGPAVVSVASPSNGYFLLSQQLDFTVSFNQTVFVTGTPRLPVMVGSTTAYADYLSGTGTNTLIFRYTVAASHSDDDGISLLSPIDLNGGDIEDALAKDAVLVYSAPTTPGIKVDALQPSIVSVTPQTAGTFKPGDNINFQVQMSENVSVSGIPRIAITTGTGTVYANYLSGSGGSLLIFRYTVGVGDLDTNGIALTSPIDLNGGTILDARTNSAILTFAPFSTLINVDGVASTISSVTPPANGTYPIGSNIDFIINWDEPVQVIGNPRLQLTVGATTIYANYSSSGSTASTSRFRYTVQEGDLDTNGISVVTAINLNGGQIKDYASNLATLTFAAPVLTSVFVDGIRPTPTLSAASPAAGWYVNGGELAFNMTWSENVTVVGTPKLNVQIGAIMAVANYDVGDSTPTNSSFKYSIVAGNQDQDGITVIPSIYLATGVTIKDAAGNNAKIFFTSPNYTAVKVDALDPSVSSIQVPAAGTYNLFDVMEFTVTFTENVTISGTPRILFKTNETALNKSANYFSGSGTSVIKFRYTVASPHEDNDGITLSTPYQIDLNGGTISDAVGNTADSVGELMFVPPSTSTILVDGVRPIVTAISGPSAGTYLIGNDLDFQFTFSDVMTVTGTPRVRLNLNGNLVWADYVSGDTTNTLTFRYTVVSGDEDLDGINLVAPLDFNGGNLQDPSLNSANPYYNPSGSFPTVKVDAKAPTFVSGTTDNHAYSTSRPNIDFKLTFSEPITVNIGGGTPRFTINIAGTNYNANYISGSGTNILVFRYTLGATETLDLDGIVVTPTIDLNGGTMLDGVGFAAPTAFTWTKKVYVYYKNILARYNFDTDNYTTTNYLGVDRITSVTNIADLISYGNLAPPSVASAPEIGSNFSTSLRKFALFGLNKYLRLPNTTLSGVKHVTIVMRHDSGAENNYVLSNIQFDATKYDGINSHKRLKVNTAWTGWYNDSYYTDSYVYPHYVANNMMVPSGVARYHITFDSAISYNTSTSHIGANSSGSSTFNGQIAEIIYWGSSLNLTTTQIGVINTQLNNMYDP